MFRSASLFNANLSGWDVSYVDDMKGMFYGASLFNGDISSWVLVRLNIWKLCFVLLLHLMEI